MRANVSDEGRTFQAARDQYIAERHVHLQLPDSTTNVSPVYVGHSGPRHQLPADTRAFTGREDELAQLLALGEHSQVGRSPGTVVIFAIDGMAGTGKTALAVHASHTLTKYFPGGQLFLDLHGSTPGMAPRKAGEVLAGVLQTFGILPQQIPPDLDARAALYRDRLSGTKTLIVLDNAASETQVRPLLPGTGGCLVLVTSRKRLKALDDARTLSLDVLSLADAVKLLCRMTGPNRTSASDPLLKEIATLCGCLPLALRIAAALIRHRPAWTLQHLADRLQEQPTLGSFSDGDRDLMAVFDLSYDTLGNDEQQLFRRLSLVPGPDADAYAAAALLDANLTETKRLLEQLVDHNLVAEPTPGRYQFHDLIRAYARAQTGNDTVADVEAAVDRLLDYYQHAAQLADRHLARHTPAYIPSTTRPPRHALDLATYDEAAQWMRTEMPNLTAAAEHSVTHAQPDHVVALSAAVAGYMYTNGPWATAGTLHHMAATMAEATGDRRGEAEALQDSGYIQHAIGRRAEATKSFARALEIWQRLEDRQGQANALLGLGYIEHAAGQFAQAEETFTGALDICRELGDRHGQAEALQGLGHIQNGTGDRARAERSFIQALDIWRELGDRHGQAETLRGLGYVLNAPGRRAEAERYLTQSLEICRELGNRHGQAEALQGLGHIQNATRRRAQAERSFTRALDICRELGDRHGQANALHGLGLVQLATRRRAEAEESFSRALDICRKLGVRRSEAEALLGLGRIQRATGQFAQAEDTFTQALDICRELGDRHGQAHSLAGLGFVQNTTGRRAEAEESFSQALDICRELGERLGQANALHGLGLVQLATRRRAEAGRSFSQAIGICLSIVVENLTWPRWYESAFSWMRRADR
jgi:tetratricopeptide (TPR) repeat protein